MFKKLVNKVRNNQITEFVVEHKVEIALIVTIIVAETMLYRYTRKTITTTQITEVWVLNDKWVESQL